MGTTFPSSLSLTPPQPSGWAYLIDNIFKRYFENLFTFSANRKPKPISRILTTGVATIGCCLYDKRPGGLGGSGFSAGAISPYLQDVGTYGCCSSNSAALDYALTWMPLNL